MSLQINTWPPAPEINVVIAKIENQWIQVTQNREEIYDEESNYQGRIPEPWERFQAAWLPSHGCGCCASNNPTPTHWMEIPKETPNG